VCDTGSAINLPGMYAAFVDMTAIPALTEDLLRHHVHPDRRYSRRRGVLSMVDTSVSSRRSRPVEIPGQ